MKTKFVTLLSASLLGALSYGQNEADVLRYSMTDFFGTARTEGMAGAFSALGADFSMLPMNPAGLARLTSSQFAFSLNTAVINTQGTYNETLALNQNRSIKPANIGIVFTSDRSHRNDGRVFRQFTLGYTRLQNFDYDRYYEGQNFNSLLDVFANDGAGIPMANDEIFFDRPFSTALGLDVNAIQYDPATTTYFPNLSAGDMFHERNIQTRGGIGDFHLAFSENFNNELYYGVSVGIRRIRYDEAIRHTETLLDPEPVTLNSFDYLFDLEARGWGINLRGGIIYLPEDYIRFGVSFETRTIQNITENFSADMVAFHDYGIETIPDEWKPFGEFKYRLRTPAKIRGSFAYIFDYKGAFTTDIEIINYRAGRLAPLPSGNFGFYQFISENSEVVAQHRPVLNARFGFEHLIAPSVFFRAGYAIQPQPFDRSIEHTRKAAQTFATGIGINGRSVNFDIGYRFRTVHLDYFAFDPSDLSNRTNFITNTHHIVFSISTRF